MEKERLLLIVRGIVSMFLINVNNRERSVCWFDLIYQVNPINKQVMNI